jgi:cold shock CspA family protein
LSSTDDSNNNRVSNDDHDDDDVDDTNQLVQQPYLTGTIKFYLREKLYGFIIPDDPMAAGGNAEVWFHRSGIQSPLSFQESPTRPYLRQRERVKFRLQPRESSGNADTTAEVDADGKKEENIRKQNATAVDVIFENGSEVPLFRQK